MFVMLSCLDWPVEIMLGIFSLVPSVPFRHGKKYRYSETALFKIWSFMRNEVSCVLLFVVYRPLWAQANTQRAEHWANSHRQDVVQQEPWLCIFVISGSFHHLVVCLYVWVHIEDGGCGCPEDLLSVAALLAVYKGLKYYTKVTCAFQSPDELISVSSWFLYP